MGKRARSGRPHPRGARASWKASHSAAQPAAQAQAATAAPAPEASAAAPAATPAVPLPDNPEALRAELATLNAELDAHQGESPLMRVCVDAHIVGDVVSGWTGIPIGKMLKDEVETVLALESHLGKPRHRAGSRAAHDQRAHPHFEGQPGRSHRSRSACSCW